jgi:hypothetical protein
MANDLYAHVKELSENPLDAMSTALAFKNIAFAGGAISDVQNVVEACNNTPLNVPTDYESAKAVVENNGVGFALSWTPLFLPCYVMDCWKGMRRGYTVSGYQVLTNVELDDSGHQNRLLLGR